MYGFVYIYHREEYMGFFFFRGGSSGNGGYFHSRTGPIKWNQLKSPPLPSNPMYYTNSPLNMMPTRGTASLYSSPQLLFPEVPLQYPMDRGAWWAAVHGVSGSRTWLSDFTFTFHLHALEKEMATHSSVLAWRTPGTGEPGGLPPMGSHRVRHNCSDLAAAAAAGCFQS